MIIVLPVAGSTIKIMGRNSGDASTPQPEGVVVKCIRGKCHNKPLDGRNKCRLHLDAARRNSRKHVAKLIANRQENQCSSCYRRDARPGKRSCEPCQNHKRKTYLARKEAGLCQCCDKPVGPRSTVLCDRHFERSKGRYQPVRSRTIPKCDDTVVPTADLRDRDNEDDMGTHLDTDNENDKEIDSNTGNGDDTAVDSDTNDDNHVDVDEDAGIKDGMDIDEAQAPSSVVYDQEMIDAARICLTIREVSLF